MNTKDIVSVLAENRDMSLAETRRLLDTMIQIFNDHLAQGNSFTIPELGTFSVHTRERHRSYNPHYEQYLMLPPKRVVKFSPSKSLKENVKHTTTEDE